MNSDELLSMFESVSLELYSIRSSDYSVDEEDEDAYYDEHLERMSAFKELLNKG